MAKKQHLIDPEICIRCNTCEATCPVGAITHDDNNYVVDVDLCNFCYDCVSPCPTGSINHFVDVPQAFSLEDQYSWTELPAIEAAADATANENGASGQETDDEVLALIAAAHQSAGGAVKAPASSTKPQINLFNRANPARAKVTGNFKLTGANASSDIHHIILDFGSSLFPVLEGQSIGIVPPGLDAKGRTHAMRLYSVASARDGEKPNTNNLSLTIKRVAEKQEDGSTFKGLGSNYMCDLKMGDEVNVIGPFGSTFLMPNDEAANVIMICTGTGSAPFRGFTERRRRAMSKATGEYHLFFGARSPEELPYFGPLQKVPQQVLKQHLCFSRVADKPKEYVQDRIRKEADAVTKLIKDANTHIFMCGLRGMETGVEEAFASLCRDAGLDWQKVKTEMRLSGRYHVETY